MKLRGCQYLGSEPSREGDQTFHGVNPTTGENLAGTFHEATMAEIDAAVKKAEIAFEGFRRISDQSRADFLESIADEILNLGEQLVDRAMSETALPQGRIVGERGRTVGQLRLFAKVVREGSWVDARIDPALPDRTPMPRVDIRHMLRPLGPVAIFGASNFPLAFSVAGGDTASALAAGCTLVIKGHPAHPGTSELVFLAMLNAAEKSGMPDGVISLVQGPSHLPGVELVKHPLIQAVGFTGSFKGGKALFDLANQRDVPIPVFAEMGSTNPVFVLPGAMQERAKSIAEGLADSVTLGVGQFCTNPGLVFTPEGDNGDFKNALANSINRMNGGTMLTSGIKSSYENGKAGAEGLGASVLTTSKRANSVTGVEAQIFTVSAGLLALNPTLSEEIFGPSSIIVESDHRSQIIKAADALEGHLTATVHGTEEDLKNYRDLLEILERKVGRIIINGFPTGVEVCSAMVHGGPFPATTNAQSTSVGTNAIKRFARPVCYQNFPDDMLPQALQNDNPLGIRRLVDGEWT